MSRLVFLATLAACSPSPADSQADGGTADTSSTTSAALYPLAMRDRWTFDVTAVGAGSTCATGSHAQEIVSANAVGGRAAFQMTSFCSGIAGTNDYSTPATDEIDFYYSGAWAMLIDPMLVDGQTWTYFNTSYHWQRATSVVVPAGSFDDCWIATQNVSYTAYLTYCRGAGLVRSYSSDLTGTGWDAQLSAMTLAP